MTDLSLAAKLVEENFDVAGDELVVGGFTASELAENFKTPLFVYDAEIFVNNLHSLRKTLGDRVDIFYSVKANPNPEVIKILVAEGAGLEIASAAEYVRCRRAGGQPERILFAGPGKGAEELAYVIERGIGEIHLESYEEIELVGEIAQRSGESVSVALRINPVGAAQGGAMRMGGKPSQFGFDEEQLADAVAAVRAMPALQLKGVHLFAGTQNLDADVLLAQWRHALELAERVGKMTGIPLATVDLGGGLGIPYFPSDQPIDLARLQEGAKALFDQIAGNRFLADARIILEPGRFLAGPAGIYLCRVRSVKESRGTTFVILDGGMHHHLAASGNLGQVIKRDYPQLLANKVAAKSEVQATIVGPLCTPLDTIGRQVMLPPPAVGDLLAVFQSGAYALTASPSGFLSQPMPAEVLVRERKAELIRPCGSFEEPITPLP